MTLKSLISESPKENLTSIFFVEETWKCLIASKYGAASWRCSRSDTLAHVSSPIPRFSLETWLASSKSRFFRLSLPARMLSSERKFEAYNLTNRFISSYSCEVVFSVDFWKRQLNWSIEGKRKKMQEGLRQRILEPCKNATYLLLGGPSNLLWPLNQPNDSETNIIQSWNFIFNQLLHTWSRSFHNVGGVRHERYYTVKAEPILSHWLFQRSNKLAAVPMFTIGMSKNLVRTSPSCGLRSLKRIIQDLFVLSLDSSIIKENGVLDIVMDSITHCVKWGARAFLTLWQWFWYVHKIIS